jgi:hypothetical protein
MCFDLPASGNIWPQVLAAWAVWDQYSRSLGRRPAFLRKTDASHRLGRCGRLLVPRDRGMFGRVRIPGGPASSGGHGRNPARQRDVDWDDFVGRFEAPDSVEVKPRVTGYLIASHFRTGNMSASGQLLFTIDARPARAQLDQARAQLARAEGAGGQRADELARSRTPRGAEGGERRGSGAASGGSAICQCRCLGRRRAPARSAA